MSQNEVEILRAEINRLKTILNHLIPEQSGQYFITGGSTELDQDGLPETILICPQFGVEGVAAYKRDGAYSAPGW